MAKRPGLYANIHAKRKRIKAGSKEKMRKKGQKGRHTFCEHIKSETLNNARRPAQAEQQWHGVARGNRSKPNRPVLGAAQKVQLQAK